MRETFLKSERLCGNEAIARLFKEGARMRLDPIRILWHLADEPGSVPARVVIVVPKSQFSKAVDRNLVRRRIREAYRKNKSLIVEHLRSENKSIHLGISYQDKQILSYKEISEKIIVLLQRLNERI